MKKSRLTFARCILAGITFLMPIGLLVVFVLYVYEKFALAIRNFYVPFYKRLGLYDILPRHVMAIGAELITILIIVIALALVGWVVLRIIRRRRIKAFHQFLENIPVIKTVYAPIKQAVDSLFGPGLSSKNRKVVRFTYPAEPCTAIGIVMEERGDDLLVMMPLTMSAGTGVLLTIPEKSVKEVLQVDAARALQHVISCGMVKLS